MGCPLSPETLSDTLLITFRRPPLLLIARAVSASASFKVLPTFILTLVDIPDPLVIA